MSPKLHCHVVGAPRDASAKYTAWPAAGAVGEYEKSADKVAAIATGRLMEFDPKLFVTVSVTVFEPGVVKVWFGFLSVDVPPSPKSHRQEVGAPVEVSVNRTD